MTEDTFFVYTEFQFQYSGMCNNLSQSNVFSVTINIIKHQPINQYQYN